jgi:cell division protein FtsN
MGGMVFAFAIFIGGVRVGIHVERERERIAQQAPSRPTSRVDKKATEDSKKKETPPPPKKQEEEKMDFTFYDTLTKKEGTQQVDKKTTSPSEKNKTTVKKEAAQPSPPPAIKDEEPKKASVAKDLYYVQIASFTENEMAETLKDSLTQKGYKVQVTAVQLEGIGLRYRVRLGGYTKLQEALDAQTKVSVEEHITETMVISEP